MRACEQMMGYLDPNDARIQTIDADTLVRRLYDNPTWNPSTYIITDLRNSGYLKTLEDEKLKAILHEWEQHYENLREWIQLETDLFNKTMDFISANGSVRNASFRGQGLSKFDVDNKLLFNSVEFENLVAHNLMITGGILSIYESKTTELINLIIESINL